MPPRNLEHQVFGNGANQNTLDRRERLSAAILREIEEEIDSVLAETPTEISDRAQEGIKSELRSYAETVLSAIPCVQLEDQGAVEAFQISIRQQARARVHQEVLLQARLRK